MNILKVWRLQNFCQGLHSTGEKNKNTDHINYSQREAVTFAAKSSCIKLTYNQFLSRVRLKNNLISMQSLHFKRKTFLLVTSWFCGPVVTFA